MIRFYNGRLLCFPEGRPLLREGEVWTDGGRISYVGDARADMPAFEREIDLRGDLLAPGFKDAHTHTAMTFLRGFAEDMPLKSWLYEKVFPMEARLTDEAVYDFTKLGIMEYLSSGITASFDMYYHNEAYVQANLDCGFRTVICSSLNDFDRDPSNIEREFLRFNGCGELIGYRLGIHAEYTTGMERMEYMAGLAKKYKAPCFTHMAETKDEVEGCLSRYGATPALLLDSLGLFDHGGGGFHCVWMSEEDIALFARKKLWAVTNPAANLKLASGIAPVSALLRAGAPMAIGTDGPSGNNALDMFREMYLTSVLQKYLLGDAAAGSAEKVLEMACVGGGLCMGLTDCDDIAVGKRADLTVIDLHRPNMQPLNDICRNLVYAGSRDNVRLTMVAGRVLYENGDFFIGEDPESVYRRANTFMDGIRA